MRYFFTVIIFAALAGSVTGQAQVVYDVDHQDRQDISKAIQIFPNPAVEFIHVRLDHVNFDKVKISVHNIIGNEINIDTEKIDDHEIRIKVKEFDTGYYLLAIKDERSKFMGTYKFLKR